MYFDIVFNFSNLIMQLPGLAPHYTKHPIFPDMLSAAIVASLISIGLNFAIAMLRKKTTDIPKMDRIMKETNEWRKQYTDAIRKKDKPRIEELKKKQAYVNKMSMEMQQQQMRPMLIYMVPSFFQPFLDRLLLYLRFTFLGSCAQIRTSKMTIIS